jgi:hypothetical protein
MVGGFGKGGGCNIENESGIFCRIATILTEIEPGLVTHLFLQFVPVFNNKSRSLS